ncbi:MAG TPA: PorV/PorQ family protein [bacterium]|nr:PorV/PorQ family protein [bacterium]
MKYKNIWTILGMTCFLLFLVQGVSAQDEQIEKVGQTGFQFLKIDVAARPAAMAGATTMGSMGADAMFYNPAGLSEMGVSGDFFASRVSWFADMNLNAGALAKDFGNWGVLGVNFVSIDYGKLIGTRVADNEQGYVETGDLDVGAYAVGVSYARALTNKFKVGGQVKFTSQRLGSNLMPDGETVKNEVSTLAYDFGTIFYPGWQSFRFGMSVRNFSPQIRYEENTFELPLTFRIGAAMSMFDLIGGLSNQSLLFEVDALHPRDYSERLHLGAEYWYSDLIALRAGYKFNYDEEGLNLGFGINYGVAGVKLKFDYAYSSFGLFNNVNRITIGGSF